MSISIKDAFIALLKYVDKQGLMGWDPYDGLNSKFFQSLPVVSKNRYFRLAWMQFIKHMPINLRPLVGISKGYNPKALGLFLSGFCNLYQLESSALSNLGLSKAVLKERIDFLVKKIPELQSEGRSGSCWGYNFDWQARAFFQPRYTPTVVATTFIGSALLDAYEITREENLLKMVRSSCDFILKDLNRTYDDKGNFAFSYSPLDKTVVFNASLLGSRLLARVYSFTKENELINAAMKSVAFCCDHQKPDGSWGYGTLYFHQWIDNFHTGYNLECIADYIKYSGDHSFEDNLQNGFEYYINTFFTENGIPKYYSNSKYPIDIHAPAQLVITLSKSGKFNENRELVDKVLNWTILNMQSDKGYFYFQKNKYFTSKIPYMRWSQAWMFYALCEYLLQINDG